MEISHTRLVPTKIFSVRGLAVVNEHQFPLQIVMIWEPFRADFAYTLQGQCFDIEKLELHVQKVVEIVSQNFQTLEVRGRNRSCGQVICISFFNFFLKFTLLYHLSFLVDVFNNSFWKMFIVFVKIILSRNSLSVTGRVRVVPFNLQRQ